MGEGAVRYSVSAILGGCSVWFVWSDFRSASSVERVEAFINLGRPDPVVYGENGQIVSWEIVKAHVEKVLAENGK